MPPKKATAAAPKAKASSSAPAHASYRDMIKEAIMALKERNGSSRSALKKYILANNKNVTPGATFDGQFNRAVKAGADKEEFALPKGPSGTVKLNKKTPVAAPKPEKPIGKKPAAAKKTATKVKTAAPKKAAAPKKTATKTKAAPKKTAATKTKAAAKPKANTSTKRAKKTPTAAPAVVDEKKVLGKTKSGRVTKNKTEPAKPSAKKTPKKTAPKKAASAKKATPKKADAAAADA